MFKGTYRFSSDYHVLFSVLRAGDRSEKRDVFVYGAVLLGLITKTAYDGEEHCRLGLEHLICFWAWVEYNKKPKSKCLLFRSKKDIKDIARTYWGVYKERKSKSCYTSEDSKVTHRGRSGPQLLIG